MIPAAIFLLINPDVSLTAGIEKTEPPPALAVGQRALLDPRSIQVRSEKAPVMRLWFRREIPVRATREQVGQGLTYRQIPEGTLVGAVELPAGFTDYRKQRIAAGVYTLRFAIQPDTGEHTDTSPHREFLLLSPAGVDRTTTAAAPKELIEQSSRVNQGRHPAVLLLWPNHDRDDRVRMLDRGKGVRTVNLLRPVTGSSRGARLGFAVTVAGHWSQ